MDSALAMTLNRNRNIPMELFCDDVRLVEFGQKRWAQPQEGTCTLNQLQFLLLMAFLVGDANVSNTVKKHETLIKNIYKLTEDDITEMQSLSPAAALDFVDKKREKRLQRAKAMTADSKELKELMRQYPIFGPPRDDTANFMCRRVVRQMGATFKGWTLLKYLGGGSFGKVFLMEKPDKQRVAVKLEMVKSIRHRQELKSEVAAQRIFHRHGLAPRVISHGEVMIEKMKMHKIVMEPVEYTLPEVLCMAGDDKLKIQSVVDQMIGVMKTMGKHNLTHGDMHAFNFGYRTVRGKLKPVLIDFGFATDAVHFPEVDVRQMIRVLVNRQFGVPYPHLDMFVDALRDYLYNLGSNYEYDGDIRGDGVLQSKLRRAVNVGYVSRSKSEPRTTPSLPRTASRTTSSRRTSSRTRTASRTTSSRRTPSRRTPSRTRTASRTTSSRRTPSRRTPSRRTPSRRTPSRRTPSRRTPSRRTPSRRTPPRAAPRARKPCRDDQSRNPATGRCRKSCRADQHRNPATGRCRKSCRADQHRNPATGRCRKNAK